MEKKLIKIPYMSKTFGKMVAYVDPEKDGGSIFRELIDGIPPEGIKKFDVNVLAEAITDIHSKTKEMVDRIHACPLKAFRDYIEFSHNGSNRYFTTTFVNQNEADNGENFYVFTPYVNGDGTLCHAVVQNMELSGPYQTAVPVRSPENAVYRNAVLDVFGDCRYSKIVTAEKVRAALGATG